jgi:hypothetical protein
LFLFQGFLSEAFFSDNGSLFAFSDSIFPVMKLRQGQVWKKGEEYIRIVHLARLEVKYKVMKDLVGREGIQHHVSKKEFCRLLKDAALLTAEEIRGTRFNSMIENLSPAAPAPSVARRASK